MLKLEIPVEDSALSELEGILAPSSGQPETVAIRILKEALEQLRSGTAPKCADAEIRQIENRI